MTISRWAKRLGVNGLVALAAVSWGALAVASEPDFLDPELAFVGSARVSNARTVELRIDIAPDYHLYRERISVEPQGTGATLGEVSIPAGKIEFDTNFQKDVEVLQGTLRIDVPVQATKADARLRVVYQGCADKGLCYPPQTAFVAVTSSDGQLVRAQWLGDNAAPAAASEPAPALASAAVASPSQSAKVESALKSGSLITIAGVFLLAGLLLAFTPCVLPMVPILSSIIVGQGAPVSRLTGFAMALSYSLGMALVYTVFGVVAGLLGEGLAAALQNPWVLGAFALMLATLSLSMFGVFELQMPSFIQSRITESSSRLPGGNFFGVFVMGGLSALIVGPCVAAPLAGALVFISQTRDVVIGGLALFSLAMGMSVPLLLVGVSAGSLLPRAGVWMEGVKTFFGVMLLAVALWIVSPVLPVWVVMLIIGSGLLVGAIYLRLFERLADTASGHQRLGKGVALLLAVLGSTQVVGALSGGDNPLQPLGHFARGPGVAKAETPASSFRRIRNVAELDAALKTADRPVMLDFYADWCVSCKEMEHLTFSDPAVQPRMAHALLLQADVTDNSAEDKALLKRFGLFGPPGVLFFDKQGREQADARVIGFVPAQGFIASLKAVGL
ncbi:MAG: protein-disulfide reductase DsbD [Burkholderiales bacterium PBB1]|nr:MAG: protein-disulfide reductase DsbD [Burkholderiales bacterium PBB1]